jgi:hypothetical protein
VTDKQILLKHPSVLMQHVMRLIGDDATPEEVDATLASIAEGATLLLARRKALRGVRP